MRKTRILAGFLFAFAASGILMLGAAGATDFRAGDDTRVGQDEVVDSTLFIAGSTVEVAGEVQGDVFCAGQNITVSGKVQGDVICAGQNIRISGMVEGDVRLAGQTINIDSEVQGNATVAGQTFTLDSAASINGDITIGSNEASVNGRIGRDVAVGGNKVVIANEVGRNIKGDIGNLELAAGANVAGDIEYTSENVVAQDDAAQVAGTITRTAPEKGADKRGAVFGFTLGWFLYWLLAMLFAALAIALLFPRVLHNASEHALHKPWKALLIGLGASLLVPAVLIVLAITIIGIPLAITLGLLWLVIAMVSGAFAGYYLGRLLIPKSQNSLMIMLVGASILTVLYFIPIIGFLVLLAGFWIGSGMILLELLRRTPKPAYEVEHTNKTLSENAKTKKKTKK